MFCTPSEYFTTSNCVFNLNCLAQVVSQITGGVPAPLPEVAEKLRCRKAPVWTFDYTTWKNRNRPLRRRNFVAEPNTSRICKICQPAEYFFGEISAQREIKATAIENQNNVQNYVYVDDRRSGSHIT